MYNNPKYSIVIPTYNHLHDCLIPCLESIKQYTDLANIEVIVVANGCVDDTANYVNSLGYPFILIEEKEQLGYTKATNLGLKAAKGEYIVLLNNDAQLLPQQKNYWLETMARPFEILERVGMTGPMLFKGIEGQSNDFVMFFCAMTTRKIIDEVGYLDEIYSPGGVEDVDYGLRLILADYKLLSVPLHEDVNKNPSMSTGSFPIFHPGGTTCSKEKGWNDILIRNNNILKQKFPQYFRGLDWIESMEKQRIIEDKKTKRIYIFVQTLNGTTANLKDLTDSINAYFLTDYEKHIIILSDNLPSAKYTLGTNCIVQNISSAGKNDASYFFELLLANQDICNDAEFICKIDADMLVYRQINSEDILPMNNQNFSVVSHFDMTHQRAASMQPENYTVAIKKELQIEPYFQACFICGKTDGFLRMAEEINNLIVADRKNNKSWTEKTEAYVNYFLSTRRDEVRFLSPAYAAPVHWQRYSPSVRKNYEEKAQMNEKIFHIV